MSNDDGASSPLALYQKAYDLHYKERKISKACDLYEEVVRQFPESDAGAYASIQLQKIRADEITRGLDRRWAFTLPVLILLAVNLFFTVFLVVVGSVQLSGAGHRRAQEKRIERALAKMSTRKDDDALDILKEAKIADPRDITPFALASDIYRRNHDFVRAREEFESFRRLNPRNLQGDVEVEGIGREESDYDAAAMKRDEERAAISERVAKKEEQEVKPRADERVKRTPRAPAIRQKSQQIVPRDSITFF
jgi:tetratricopeptide (TPR) repeat protein